MDNPLAITLTLKQNECIRGESVFFEVAISNASTTPIPDFPPLAADLKTVLLSVQGAKGIVTAHQLSADGRDGVHHHEPRDQRPTSTLAPRAKVTLNGDLLEWFGELEPGRYEVTASHRFGAVSPPVSLKVQTAAATFASTPRYAAQAPGAPFTAAWTHQAGEDTLLFYQQYSATLPRNPRHGIRVANVKEPVEPIAATMPDGGFPTGHLIWLDPKDKLRVANITIGDDAKIGGWEIKPPFKGGLMASPASMPGGRVFVPLQSEDQKRVAILEIDASGNVTTHEPDVGKTQGLGPYVCFWEYDARVNFCWAGPNGREILHARLPLNDTAAGFVTRSAYVSDDPILWIDAYLDSKTTFREAPYFEEQLPPEQRGQVQLPPPASLILWCVAVTAVGLRCLRVDVAKNTSRVDQVFNVGEAKNVRVLSSVVTNEDHQVAMLLADEKDKLYFASTTSRSFEPLEKVTSEPITLESFPALITASRQGRSPWVYLRYIAKDKVVRLVRLEPRGSRDPVERSATLPTRRRRR